MDGAKDALEGVSLERESKAPALWHHFELRGFGRHALGRARRLLQERQGVQGVQAPMFAGRIDLPAPTHEELHVREAERRLFEVETAASALFQQLGLRAVAVLAELEAGIRWAGFDRGADDIVGLLRLKPLDPLLLSVDDERMLSDAWFARVGIRLAGEEFERQWRRPELTNAPMAADGVLRERLRRSDGEVRDALDQERVMGVRQRRNFDALTRRWGKVYGLADESIPVREGRALLGKGDLPWSTEDTRFLY